MSMSKIAQPLVMVEVIPIINITDVDDTKSNHDGKGYSPPIISTPSAKLQLLNMSRQGMFTKGWLDTGDDRNCPLQKEAWYRQAR